jgi:hypothetical protein
MVGAVALVGSILFLGEGSSGPPPGSGPVPHADFVADTVSPTAPIGTQLGFLKMPGPIGLTVAISGDTLAVGAPYRRGGGGVYVFDRTAGGGWRQTALLVGDDTSAGDGLGASVAVSGETVMASASGAHAGRTYVFEKRANGWRQVTELVGDATSSQAGAPRDAIAISGGLALVSAQNGSATLLRQTGDTWRPAGHLHGAGAAPGADYYFTRVAISGDTAVVTGLMELPHVANWWPENDIPGEGVVAWVFSRTAAGWRQTARIGEAHNPNVAVGDVTDLAVAVSGSRVLLSRLGVTCGEGNVRTFSKSASGWTNVSGILRLGCFGSTLAISGSIGLSSDLFGRNSESVHMVRYHQYRALFAGWNTAGYLFSESNRGWRQRAVLRGAGGTGCGFSAALSDGMAAVSCKGGVRLFKT